MGLLIKGNRHEWNRPYLMLPKDHFKSNEFIHEKPFIPSFINRHTRPDMYMLLRWDYSRIYAREHRDYIDERILRESKKLIKPVLRDITGLDKKKAVIDDEPKEMFKMSK